MINSHDASSIGYILNPERVGFENQEHGEHIILLLRQHPATQILPVIFIAVLIVLPFVTVAVVNNVISLGSILKFSKLELTFVLAVWYLVVFGLAFERFLLWYFNVYILTNERIIDVDFLGVAFKRVSECRLPQVQDVTSATSGSIETFFDYGSVYVQTAAENPEFEFRSVPKPAQVVRQVGIQCRLEEAEQPGIIA